jgi:hypothetical protein
MSASNRAGGINKLGDADADPSDRSPAVIRLRSQPLGERNDIMQNRFSAALRLGGDLLAGEE